MGQLQIQTGLGDFVKIARNSIVFSSGWCARYYQPRRQRSRGIGAGAKPCTSCPANHLTWDAHHHIAAPFPLARRSKMGPNVEPGILPKLLACGKPQNVRANGTSHFHLYAGHVVILVRFLLVLVVRLVAMTLPSWSPSPSGSIPEAGSG